MQSNFNALKGIETTIKISILTSCNIRRMVMINILMVSAALVLLVIAVGVPLSMLLGALSRSSHAES